MKKILLLVALVCVSVASASAQETQVQEKGVQFLIEYHGTTCSPFNFNPEFSTTSFEFAPGYAFNSVLAVRVPFTFATELYQNGAVKTFDRNVMMIGGTLAFEPFVLPNIGGGIEFAVSFGGTVTGGDAKYLYYDAGVAFHFGGGLNDFNIGLGFRYYQSMTSAFKNRPAMYASIGYRFN